MAKSTEALFALPYNQSVRIKAASNNHTTSDAGALLMRSVIARTGLIEFLTERLYDPRNQDRIQYSLAQLLLQWLLQLIQGWSALWTEQLRTDAAFGMSPQPNSHFVACIQIVMNEMGIEPLVNPRFNHFILIVVEPHTLNLIHETGFPERTSHNFLYPPPERTELSVHTRLQSSSLSLFRNSRACATEY